MEGALTASCDLEDADIAVRAGTPDAGASREGAPLPVVSCPEEEFCPAATCFVEVAAATLEAPVTSPVAPVLADTFTAGAMPLLIAARPETPTAETVGLTDIAADSAFGSALAALAAAEAATCAGFAPLVVTLATGAATFTGRLAFMPPVPVTTATGVVRAAGTVDACSTRCNWSCT
jgi:hypothetical protein